MTRAPEGISTLEKGQDRQDSNKIYIQARLNRIQVGGLSITPPAPIYIPEPRCRSRIRMLEV